MLGHFWHESYGHIYPILRRLHRDGLVEKSVEAHDGLPNRHVYSITSDGHAELEEWLRRPVEHTPPRNELLLKVAHAWLDIDNEGSAEDFTALLPATSWRTAAGAAGSIITSARDLAVFTRAFVGGRLHGAVMAARAQQWVDRPDGHRHGLGVIQVDLDGEHLVGHRGHAAGYSAEAWHSAETGRTLVVLTNAHALLLTPMVQALL